MVYVVGCVCRLWLLVVVREQKLSVLLLRNRSALLLHSRSAPVAVQECPPPVRRWVLGIWVVTFVLVILGLVLFSIVVLAVMVVVEGCVCG